MVNGFCSFFSAITLKARKETTFVNTDEKMTRAWVEIDLRAIEDNFDMVQRYADGKPIICVVKADAYGHGATQVARRLAKAGAARFAVATVAEGVALREAGIKQPIMLLGYADRAEMPAAINNDIICPVYDSETAHMLSQTALALGATVTVHFKLDTGMTRLGFPARHTRQTVRQILELSKLPGLNPEGAFTHFAAADTVGGEDFTQRQFALFRTVCEQLEEEGLHLAVKHCANSAGVLQYKESYFDMVRAGIILYGYPPDRALALPVRLRPAMAVKARIAQVRDMEAGQMVSYGCTYTAPDSLREAVVTFGYADGFLRTGSGKASIVIDSRPAPVLGRICMDMIMVGIPQGARAARGDEVTIFGDGPITADDIAAAAGTISYEVLCAVSARVPRIYVN